MPQLEVENDDRASEPTNLLDVSRIESCQSEGIVVVECRLLDVSWQISSLEKAYDCFVEFDEIYSVIVVKFVQIAIVSIDHFLVCHEFVNVKGILVHFKCTFDVSLKDFILNFSSVLYLFPSFLSPLLL